MLPRQREARRVLRKGRCDAETAQQLLRDTYEFAEDFPERLKRFQMESGLSWSEIARRIGTYRSTVSRWKRGEGRPNMKHMMALLELAESLGLRHIFDGGAGTSER